MVFFFSKYGFFTFGKNSILKKFFEKKIFFFFEKSFSRFLNDAASEKASKTGFRTSMGSVWPPSFHPKIGLMTRYWEKTEIVFIDKLSIRFDIESCIFCLKVRFFRRGIDSWDKIRWWNHGQIRDYWFL